MADGRKGPGSNQYQDKPPSPATAARPAVAASLRQQAAAEAAPPQWAANCTTDFNPEEAMRRHIAARNADPRLAAGLLPAGECGDCDRLASRGGVVPRHKGGCRPHCTCDGCF